MPKRKFRKTFIVRTESALKAKRIVKEECAREGFDCRIISVRKKNNTTFHVVFEEWDARENPFRLGQRRVYPVKGKRKPRYRGASETRRKTYTTKRTAVLASNPKRTCIYGRVIRIDAQKTQKHLCDTACKRYGHKYTHGFKSGAKMYGLPNGDILISSR